MPDQLSLQNFINLCLKRILPRITLNLSVKQAEWVQSALESSILPDAYRRGAPDDNLELQSIVEVVTSEIVDGCQELSPEKLMLRLMEQHLTTEFSWISSEAFDAAIAASGKGTPDQKAVQRAFEIKVKLERVLNDMEKYAPALRNQFAGQISDALLDCSYAMGKHNRISLRMRRAIL